jgi:hypothetical protein
MSLTLQQLSAVMLDSNKTGFKQSASRRSGKIINDRLIALIKPKLPMLLKGYADSEIGRFVMANLLAAAAVKFGASQPKLLIAAEMSVADATDQFLGSFAIEDIINELLDGIELPSTEQARETTASGLRRAAEAVAPATNPFSKEA